MARTKDTSRSRTDHASTVQGAGVAPSLAPYVIENKNPRYTRNLLQHLLDAPVAERLHGIAVVGMKEDGQLVTVVAGRFSFNMKEAHWAASVLKSRLLEYSLKEVQQNG